MSNRPLHIVILAAGKGSRMHSSTPKVLHKVAGKSLLGHVIDSSLKLEPEHIHIVVGHGKEQVVEAFDGHISRAKLNWIEQTEQLGTGHAVSTALPNIQGDANVLMLTADVPLMQANTLASMVDAMQSHSLVLLTAIVDNPSGLGRITRDESNTVTGIVEQKDASAAEQKICEINSGIICAHKEPLTQWLSKVSNDNAQKEYYLTDIVDIAHQSGHPIAAQHPADNAEVMGINSRSQLAHVERLYQHVKAEQLMAAGVTILDPARIDIRGDVEIGVDTTIDINVVIEGPTKIGAGVHIAPNCLILQSEIDDGATIHPNTVIENAKLGRNVNVGPFARLRPGTNLSDSVRIGNFVETKNAKLDVGVKVNHLSYVGDATVGRDTNIGAGVITCNYDGAYKHQTTIGQNVFVGSDSQLVAPVEIEDGATIGAGSTITSKVDKDHLAISRAKQRQISGWQRPKKESK